jgi:hypothetical protein
VRKRIFLFLLSIRISFVFNNNTLLPTTLKHPVHCPLQSYVRTSSISLLFPVRSHRKYTPSTSLLVSFKNREMTTSGFIVNSPRNILVPECTKELVLVHYNKIGTREVKVR